jgi:hypothetical protein
MMAAAKMLGATLWLIAAQNPLMVTGVLLLAIAVAGLLHSLRADIAAVDSALERLDG